MLLGLLSGGASAGLVALINSAVYSGSWGHRARWMLAAAFAAIVLLKVSTSLASGLVMGRSLQNIMLNLSAALCRKVAATPLRKLEEFGTPRVMACLTDDIPVLAGAIQAIPTLVVSLAMVAGCAIYLAYINWMAAAILVVLIVVIAAAYQFIVARAFVAIQRAREGRDTVLRHFRALIEGIKELKLHRERREAFFQEDLDAAMGYMREQNIIAMNRYAVADGWSQSMFYTLLGVVLFAIPILNHVSLKTLTAYIFAALYMTAPIWGIIGAFPGFSRGRAALEKLEELGLVLTEMVPADSKADSLSLARWSRVASTQTPPTVEVRNAVFRYTEKENDHGFTLGPINLTLHPGELVFVIGGNGSGKSTLAKLLTGLYTPESGEICVDGIPLLSEDQEAYRQLFSAVFYDFYLFDRLLGLCKSEETEARAKEYLAALGLSNKVAIVGNSYSTTALSQGQRRRLALLAAYMEDRPIYVLDEWAADQDPGFRQIFYQELLPELRSKGKTIVVITHDDRYFQLGDRVIKLDYGKVVQSSRLAVPTAYSPT